jgi:glucokinase
VNVVCRVRSRLRIARQEVKSAAIGIDVGGTKTLCLLVDERCRILESLKFKTAPHKGRGQFTEKLLEALQALKTKAQKRGFRIVTVGAACAGQIDPKKLKIRTSQNLLCLEQYPIGKHVESVLKAPLTLANDVQMGIYGEYQLGAAKGASHVLGIFFGTGVGGAAIINKRLYFGAAGCGGQVGAVLAQPVGGPQAALSHGLVDRIASKTAIASEALVMAIKNWAPYLHKRVDTDLAKVTWGMLDRAIRHGDARIEEMLRARMRVVGIALSSVVNFMSPDLIVLGGGLMDSLPKLVLQEFDAGLREYVAPEIRKHFKVRPAKLGGNAVALGVAFSALEQMKK